MRYKIAPLPVPCWNNVIHKMAPEPVTPCIALVKAIYKMAPCPMIARVALIQIKKWPFAQ